MTTQTETKRDAVTRIHEALLDNGYRCSQTALANKVYEARNAFTKRRTKSGWDFSLWFGKNGSFVLWANEETQEYEFFKATATKTVDEDIALL